MATIIKKKKKGRPYYYAVESKRINGKPRIVWQKYLGTVDSLLLHAKRNQPPKPKETVIFEAGGVSALLGIAQRLDLLNLINTVIPKRQQGATVGHYMLLAALNRALEPCSKIAIGDWYESTVLRRLWKFPKSVFSSQRFWDHMDMLTEEKILTIQEKLIPHIKSKFGFNSELLLYDTTNFFTFLATTNNRANLPQRGYSKAKRHDLRQVGLALLVTRDFQIPLLHHVYQGNIPDVALFPQLSKDMIARYRKISDDYKEATLIFDRGNSSDEIMEQIVVSPIHFIAALTATRLPEMLATPLNKFKDIPDMPGTQFYSRTMNLWGKKCKVVVVYTESFFTQQLQGITQNLVKCQKELMELEKNLNKWQKDYGKGKQPTIKGVNKKVDDILSVQFMKKLFSITVDQQNKIPSLSYKVDHIKLQQLTDNRLGRIVLSTDLIDWPDEEIIRSYRNLASIEDVFKNMKNVNFLHWQPAYHWTDQKIRVHGFYCVMALLLATLSGKVAFEHGIKLPLPKLLKELSDIKETAIIYPKGTPAHPKDYITLSRMSPRQRKLAECLEIGKFI
jgi:transposase